MTTTALLIATLLVGQTAPPLVGPTYNATTAGPAEPPQYQPAVDGPAEPPRYQPAVEAPAAPPQYSPATEDNASPVVVAGLGVPVPSSMPGQRSPSLSPPFAPSRSPSLAPAAPLAITAPDQEFAPRRGTEIPLGPPRTIHSVEPNLSTSPPATANSSLAGALVDRALTPPRDRALHGRPLTLTEAFSGAKSSRSEVVARYWECTVRMAEYHSALDEYARLAALPLPQTNDARSLLAAAQAAAKAQADAAELAASSAQYDLADVLSTAFGSEAPLPTETPLVAAYRTQFDLLFADRTAPVGLKRIHETLPLVHRSLQSRAEAVIAAEDAAGMQDDNYRRGAADLHAVLAAHDAVANERRSFFSTLLDYNTRVAQYALAVAGSESANTLVTTLVENPALSASSASRSVLVRGNTTPTPTVTAEPLAAGDAGALGVPAWQNREPLAPTTRMPAREAQIPGFNGGQWK